MARVKKRSGRGLDRGDLERVHVAVLVADRDIFAGPERMRAEPVAGLVVVLRGLVVVEDPAGVLPTARLVHQHADLVRLASPEPPHPTMRPVLAPQLDVDMPRAVERCDELVAVPRRPAGKLLGTGEIEPDALEHMRKLGHGADSRVAGPTGPETTLAPSPPSGVDISQRGRFLRW